MDESPRQIQLSTEHCKTILIADDEEQMRSLMEDTLGMFGYCVITAKNGREAVELYRQHSEIDLVIVDIIMPELDGVQTSKEILKINPNTKIIFATGYASGKLDSNHNMRLIQKPFLPSELLKEVRKALDETQYPITKAKDSFNRPDRNSSPHKPQPSAVKVQ